MQNHCTNFAVPVTHGKNPCCLIHTTHIPCSVESGITVHLYSIEIVIIILDNNYFYILTYMYRRRACLNLRQKDYFRKLDHIRKANYANLTWVVTGRSQNLNTNVGTSRSRPYNFLLLRFVAVVFLSRSRMLVMTASFPSHFSLIVLLLHII